MAEVSFLSSANTRKRASASRESYYGQEKCKENFMVFTPFNPPTQAETQIGFSCFAGFGCFFLNHTASKSFLHFGECLWKNCKLHWMFQACFLDGVDHRSERWRNYESGIPISFSSWHLRNRKHVPCFYQLKHVWKFGRTRNAVGTRAAPKLLRVFLFNK